MILLLGLTVVGTTAIVVYGGAALNDTENAMESRNVEHAMKQLDARASRVAIGSSSAQEVTIPTQNDGTLRSESDSGWINVSVKNRSSGEVTTIVNQTLGQVVYANDGKKIAYQGGGVWKTQEGNSVMLSSPEMHFRGQTLTLPIVTIQDDQEFSDQVRIEANGSAERKFPGSTDFDNPISGNKHVNVTIHSEYYEAWADFMLDRAGGVVHVDDDKQTVTLELVSQRKKKQSNIQGGVQSTSTGTSPKYTLGNGAFVTSYNATKYDNGGDRAETLNGSRGEGDVYVSGKIKLQDDSRISGDVHVGGQSKLSDEETEIDGNLTCYEGGRHPSNACPNKNDGTITEDVETVDDTLPEVQTVEEKLGFTVEEKINDLQHNNNNSNTSAISGEAWASDDEVEVGPGEYYVEDMQLSGGKTVILNLTKHGGGNITVGVDGKLNLDSDGAVCIVYGEKDSNNKAQMFLTSQSGGSSEVTIDNGYDVITVDVDNIDNGDFDCNDDKDDDGNDVSDEVDPGAYNGTHVSTKFWLFAAPGMDADLDGGVDFTGVFYAPGTKSNPGDIDLAGGRIYGAAIAQVDDTDENNRKAAIFYDTALEEASAVRLVNGNRPVRVSYLHISVNRVNVSG
jgi:hypothetical protein